ncbi:MAG: UvrD-helicase domain-containing protein [Synergistaceae bacterium]|nr:UvrD-helicase domain-containing protein [Synergistaceae bacterium]
MNFSLPIDTPEGQKKAISTDEKIITVGAGAGTGKTWVLSQRYLRLLLENEDISPSNILTLTYTEAAASEMKQRIIAMIENELEDFHDEARKRKILDGLADSWISTIHSFAARLIREAGLSLDIDPKASVISTQQENEFWEGIKNAAEFANFRELARAYGDKQLRDVAKFLDNDEYFSACVSKWSAGTLSEFARKTAELHASSGHSWKEMLEWAEDDKLIAETRPAIEKILADEWADVWDFWSQFTNLPKPKKSGGSGEKLVNILTTRAKNPLLDDVRKFYEDIVIDAGKEIVGTAGQPFKAFKEETGLTFGDWRKTRPELIKKITPDYDKNFSDEELRMRKSLMKFCALSWGLYNEMKSHRRLMSFSDMILHAKKAIADGAVKREFAHVLVDEFQDTDELQYDMIYSLAEKSNLFAVGDPKQSIYKFRHANPALFAKIIKLSNTYIELDTSFRTRQSLLTRINNLFAKLWVDGLGHSEGMEGLYYNSLNSAVNESERNSGTMPDFRVYLARHDKNNTNEARKILADNIACKIASWVKDELTIWDKREKVIRPVKFSDFAILSRSRSIYPVLEEALNKFGIKSVQDKSTDYFSRGEVNDVVCLLRAAANFNDHFAVAGWLMSPFSGVPEEEAITKCLRLADKETRPIDLIKQNLPEAFSRLEYLALVGEHEGPAGLLALFDKNRKWLACYDVDDRMRVLRNLRLALSVARNFQTGGTSTLVSCAEYMTRAVRDEISFEEPAWHDENENAVRLGVVHSAKGLEYPVTIIFEHRVKKDVDRGALRPSRKLGVVFSSFPDEILEHLDVRQDSDENINSQGLKQDDTEGIISQASNNGQQGDENVYASTEKKQADAETSNSQASKQDDTGAREITPQGHNWEKLLSEQGDAEEEERLFYVAATRAQDSLIFCGLIDDKTGEPHNHTWTKLLLDNLDDCFMPEEVSALNDGELQALSYDEDEKVLIPVDVVNVRNSLRQFSASSFALFEFCPFAWRRSYRQGINLTWELPNDDNPDEISYGGAELGSLAHWVLAHENYYERLDDLLHNKENISRLPGYLRDIWRDEKAKSSLEGWLKNFAVSELGVMLREQKDLKHEYRFRLKLNEKITLAGSIDGFFGGNSLVDYKITSIDNVPPGLYQSQLEFYAFVVHELTGAEKVNTFIAFLKEGKIEAKTYDNFAEIRARIEKSAEICASGPYNPNHKNCGLCPFKKGCVKIAG